MCQGQEHSEATVVGGPLLDLAAIQRVAAQIKARVVRAGGLNVQIGAHQLSLSILDGPGDGDLAALRALLEQVDAALAAGGYTTQVNGSIDGLPLAQITVSLEV